MKMLLTLDLNNYTDNMPVVEKHTVRAVILRDGMLAMQQNRKGEYKMPGGGVEPGESHLDTLIREVREEVGLLVIPESVKEIGEILELREDVFCKGTKYICHSYFYFCSVQDKAVPTEMTPSEIQKGFHPAWQTPDEICRVNDSLQKQLWMKRDTEFIRMLAEGKIS